MGEQETQLPLMSSSSSPFDDDVFRVAQECVDEFCGFWGPAPPVFDIPPPPKPPFMWDGQEPCSTDQDEASSGFPSPVVATRALDPASQISAAGGLSPYDSCDNFLNPMVVDSKIFAENNFIQLLIIVICSLVLVGVLMVLAVFFWRKYYLFRCPGLAIDKHGGGVRLPCQEMTVTVSSENQPQYFSTLARSHDHLKSVPTEWKAKKRKQANSPGSRHVYANPNYPSSASGHLEIGGSPFYLPPTNCPESGAVMETSLSQRLKPNSALFEAGNFDPPEGDGPIYEDIDRMCSYRGQPPGPLRPADGDDNQQSNFSSTIALGHVIVNPLSPAAFQRLKTMSSQNDRNKSPQSVYSAKLATLSSSAQSSPSKKSSSIYYYSDTLRNSDKTQNKGRTEHSKTRVDSDSGISDSRDFPMEAVDFRKGKNLRQQVLLVNASPVANMSSNSSPSSSPSLASAYSRTNANSSPQIAAPKLQLQPHGSSKLIRHKFV